MTLQVSMRWMISIGCLMLAGFGLPAVAQSERAPHIAELTIDGPIGPATTDYLVRSMETAREQGARAILIRMDTPGGLDSSTRDIIKAILASPLPVITYVHPAGSRAASAGTYILYASHIAAMTPSTTLGAATPVQMGGGGGLIPGGQQGDENGQDSQQGQEGEKQGGKSSPAPPDDAMKRKVINDSVAFIRGLANRHGRNADWAERAVREAATLTARAALERNVVDVVAKSRQSLFEQVDGREVDLESGPATLAIGELPIRNYAPDWRSKFLGIVTNPQVASILLLIGIYGLLLEGYNPGAMVPGVVGIICLLIGLYAMQVLPINYAGVALIALGAILIVAEAFVPSFGVLGIGGVVALVMGSIMLVDTDVPGMEVSYELVGAIAAVGGLAVLGIITMMGRSLRIPRKASDKAMVGCPGQVVQVMEQGYKVSVSGEFWNAHSDDSLNVGQSVEVVDQDVLTLIVRAA